MLSLLSKGDNGNEILDILELITEDNISEGNQFYYEFAADSIEF
jgi:hypothetical protein